MIAEVVSLERRAAFPRLAERTLVGLEGRRPYALLSGFQALDNA
jgi:hypothetical protein